MRLGRAEETFRNGKVVTANAKWILGDNASELVQLDPLHRGVTVSEDAGRKPCILAMEDPNGRPFGLYFGIVLRHEGNIYHRRGRSPAMLAHLPLIALPRGWGRPGWWPVRFIGGG